MHLICRYMQGICMKYARNMQKICKYMRGICTWYAPYMQIYAENMNMQKICRKYAENMQKYAPDMHLICNMQEYARICIGAYEFAYFAYICTPHFADVSTITVTVTDHRAESGTGMTVRDSVRVRVVGTQAHCQWQAIIRWSCQWCRGSESLAWCHYYQDGHSDWQSAMAIRVHDSDDDQLE